MKLRDLLLLQAGWLYFQFSAVLCLSQARVSEIRRRGVLTPNVTESICHRMGVIGVSQVAQLAKNLPANAGDVKDVGLIPGSGTSPAGRHGHALHYSGLENPVDRGACRAAVHGVTQSRTWLRWLSRCTCHMVIDYGSPWQCTLGGWVWSFFPVISCGQWGHESSMKAARKNGGQKLY